MNLLKSFILSVLSFYYTSVCAYDFEVNGIFYEITYNNYCSVTYETVFKNTVQYSGDIVIPSSVDYNGNNYVVKEIGTWAFRDCYGLTSVTIPETVTSFGMGSFDNCTNLSAIYDYAKKPQNAFLTFKQDSYAFTVHVYEGLKSVYEKDWNNLTIVDDIKVIKVMSIEFDKQEYECLVDSSFTINSYITPHDATYRELKWVSSDNTIAMVSNNGTVTGKKEGKVIIKASATDGGDVSTQCVVTVKTKKVERIEFDKSKYVCYPYESVIVTPIVFPSDASNPNLEWNCSNDSVAYITNSGKVIGIKEGTATISVKSKDGSDISAQCEIEVKALQNTEVSSYNQYLTLRNGGVSMISMGGFVQKSVGFIIENIGSDCIYLSKIIWKTPDTYTVIGSSSDISLLGWLANGEKKELAVRLTSDIMPVYEFHYIYKGKSFVYCSDTNDSADINSSIEEKTEKVGYYSLDGRKEKSLKSGFNIVRYADGTARKFFKKRH